MMGVTLRKRFVLEIVQRKPTKLSWITKITSKHILILFEAITVPLSTQVYKWVPANLMLGGNPAMD